MRRRRGLSPSRVVTAPIKRSVATTRLIRTPSAGNSKFTSPRFTIHRIDALKELAVPILVALVALGGTYLGSPMTADTTTRSQMARLAEDRANVEKEKRTDIYFRFLEQTEEFNSQQRKRIATCFFEIVENLLGDVLAKPLRECVLADGRVVNLLASVRRVRNEVYVYGTSEANDVANFDSRELVVHR